MLVKNLLFAIGIAIFISSCSSMGKITIQTAIPPKYPVSAEIQSLAVINRSITPDFSNLSRDSLEKILVKNDLFLDTVIHDSIAADTSIQIAAKALFESDRYDVVVPKQRNIVRTDNGGSLRSLDKEYINSVCKDFNVDAVLVLEDFSQKVITRLEVVELSRGFANIYREYSAEYNIVYNQIWRLYQPQLTPSILRFDVRDTLVWNSFDYSLSYMYDKLPSIKEAMIDGGIASGIDMANIISPKWRDEFRHYYRTGKKEIDAAIPLIKANKWEEAAAIWKKYSSTSSKNLRSMVEFNLALAAEMAGNFNEAIEWGLKSYKSRYSRKTETYLKYLDQRRETLQRAEKK